MTVDVNLAIILGGYVMNLIAYLLVSLGMEDMPRLAPGLKKTVLRCSAAAGLVPYLLMVGFLAGAVTNKKN